MVFHDDTEDEDEEPTMERTLLEQLEELHRQLAAVRQDADPRRVVGEDNKIIICSLTRCVTMEKSSHDDSWLYHASTGGFHDAIQALQLANDVQWVSWPGVAVDETSREGVSRKLETEFNCKPVFLSNETIDLFHHRFCNTLLWSIMHCLPHQSDIGLLDSFNESYDAYCTANQQFLEAVSEVYNEGDFVLVCGYQLMNLPALLRRRFSDIVCGFFLHCPFPSSEFYRMLPVRQSLLHGMLGADLVVFNHFDYVRHFLNACTRMLGLESSPSRIEYNGRLVSLGICPMGINPERFIMTDDVQLQIETMQTRFFGFKVIVSVDKLDFCKGIPQKLAAFEHLLEVHSHYRGEVIMCVCVLDSDRTNSTHYRVLNRQIHEMVGRINGRFGAPEYCPILYLRNMLSQPRLTALYSIADVAVVSSLKEGINLQAMEFIAAQHDSSNPGVLVYSEFAGCATFFKGALMVNPFDTEQMGSSLDTALQMGATTKKIRYHQLYRYVHTYTAGLWAQRIMTALTTADATSREYNVLVKLDYSQILSHFERSDERRLFLLDYDGTLVPYQSMSQLAAPSAAVLSCLEELTQDPQNSVYIVSGRSRTDLQKWFEGVPRIGIAAENGYWLKPADHSKVSNETTTTENSENLAEKAHESDGEEDESKNQSWQCHEHNLDMKWHEDVESLLEHFTKRTPGSLLEAKDSCFTWHFRDADPDFGLNQAKDLQLHLDQMLSNKPVSVVMAPLKKYIVVRPTRLTKGRAVMRIIDCERSTFAFAPQLDSTPRLFDFILAIGDERTDEDMFDVAESKDAFTCTVGRKASRAGSYLDDPEEVLRVLTALSKWKTEAPVDVNISN